MQCGRDKFDSGFPRWLLHSNSFFSQLCARGRLRICEPHCSASRCSWWRTICKAFRSLLISYLRHHRKHKSLRKWTNTVLTQNFRQRNESFFRQCVSSRSVPSGGPLFNLAASMFCSNKKSELVFVFQHTPQPLGLEIWVRNLKFRSRRMCGFPQSPRSGFFPRGHGPNWPKAKDLGHGQILNNIVPQRLSNAQVVMCTLIFALRSRQSVKPRSP